MQLSIIGQRETSRQLEKLGFQTRVIDFSFFPFSEVFEGNRAQIQRVKQLSDAFDMRLAGKDLIVAYLLEVTRSVAR
jgi:hypothetical protein